MLQFVCTEAVSGRSGTCRLQGSKDRWSSSPIPLSFSQIFVLATSGSRLLEQRPALKKQRDSVRGWNLGTDNPFQSQVCYILLIQFGQVTQPWCLGLLICKIGCQHLHCPYVDQIGEELSKSLVIYIVSPLKPSPPKHRHTHTLANAKVQGRTKAQHRSQLHAESPPLG